MHSNEDTWFFDKCRQDNLLNAITDDTPIYRVFSKDRFVQTIKEKKITLVRPKLWDDPFENLLLSSKIVTPNNKIISLESLKSAYYGQCWTTNPESDAMWRIYSHNKDGVKVKTTVKKLFDCLYYSANSPEISCFFGKVIYIQESQLINMLKNSTWVYDNIFDTTGNKPARSLLFKRNEFAHESEARIIYSNPNSGDDKGNVYTFPIEIESIFDEITADPRIDEEDFQKLAHEIRTLGISRTPINKSSLYRIPEITVQWPHAI